MIRPLLTPPVRRFYRLVSQDDPPARDFSSLFATTGRVFPDPAAQELAEEVSVWDSFERAARQRTKKPQLGFVAVLDIPGQVQLRKGKRGHFGIPKSISPDEIRTWVVEVVALPLAEESSR